MSSPANKPRLPARRETTDDEDAHASPPKRPRHMEGLIKPNPDDNSEHFVGDSEADPLNGEVHKDEDGNDNNEDEQEDGINESVEEEAGTDDPLIDEDPLLVPGKESAPPPSYLTIKSDPTQPSNFNEFLFALLSFKAEHGNYSVNKEDSPLLYNWLAHMKREYTRHTHRPTASTLTTEQRKVLELLHVPLTHRGDDHWNRFFGMLEKYKARHGHVLVPRICEVPSLGDWVTDQRRQFKAWKLGKPSQLTLDRRERLEKLGFMWQVRYRPEWDQRFQELLEYKQKHADCKVPQNFRENRALGKWVAKQREQWKLKQKGQHSFLTPDREEKLTAVGFVWSLRTGRDDDLGEPADDTPPIAMSPRKSTTDALEDAPTKGFAWAEQTGKDDGLTEPTSHDVPAPSLPLQTTDTNPLESATKQSVV